MSYTPIHDYAIKDTLSKGNPEKLVKGQDLTDDFTAIADALPESGDAAGKMTFWDGLNWKNTTDVQYNDDANPAAKEFTVTCNMRMGGDHNIYGNSNESTQYFFGDCYVGYDSSIPDNSDQQLGTLFLGRGALVGRGLPVGTASIGMEGNIIFGLGDPYDPLHATNKQYVDAAAATFSAQTLQTISAVQTALSVATDFETFRADLAGRLATLQAELTA